MKEKEQCKAFTIKSERCKKNANFRGYCSVHRHMAEDINKGPSIRDKRLLDLLVAGTSLILIVEKAIQYMPNIIQYWTPPQDPPVTKDVIDEIKMIIELEDFEKIDKHIYYLLSPLSRLSRAELIPEGYKYESEIAKEERMQLFRAYDEYIICRQEYISSESV